jgi:hypothetical protein
MRSLIIMSLTCLMAVVVVAIASDADKPRSGLHLYYVKDRTPQLTTHVAEGRKVSPVVKKDAGLFRLSWNFSDDE